MEERRNKEDTKLLIECPICLEFITNPKSIIPCIHTFCERCLIKALSQGKKECPSCRRVLALADTQTIEDYVNNLPLNGIINDLLNKTVKGKHP